MTYLKVTRMANLLYRDDQALSVITMVTYNLNKWSNIIQGGVELIVIHISPYVQTYFFKIYACLLKVLYLIYLTQLIMHIICYPTNQRLDDSQKEELKHCHL